VAQVVASLLSKPEALSLNFSTAKKIIRKINDRFNKCFTKDGVDIYQGPALTRVNRIKIDT
jgi:hypothetical protein